MTQQINIYQTIKTILQTARDNAYKQVNFIMVEAYYKSFPIRSTLWSELSWSNYKLIIRVEDESAKDYCLSKVEF